MEEKLISVIPQTVVNKIKLLLLCLILVRFQSGKKEPMPSGSTEEI